MAWRRTEGEVVELPSNIRVGQRWYSVNQQQAHKVHHYGRVDYVLRRITINTVTKGGAKIPAADVRETFWHELTHAILYEMNNDLHNNEVFVKKFSHLLSKAVDSARFANE
jgi:hypothetical protein